MSGSSFVLVCPFDLGTELGIGPTAIVAPDALLGAVGLSRLGVETNGRFHLFALIGMGIKKSN
jgi:hypothetical protein